MKRLHVHVSVRDLEASIRFYVELFASEPSVRKSDYAKWMLEDPRSISDQPPREPGRDQAWRPASGDPGRDRPELEEVYARLKRAEAPVFEEGATTCCYAQSEKNWIDDPQGVPWEVFLTTGKRQVYGRDSVGRGRAVLRGEVRLARLAAKFAMDELAVVTQSDLEAVSALLQCAGLPTSDLETARPEFLVVREDGRIIAAGALQRFGSRPCCAPSSSPPSVGEALWVEGLSRNLSARRGRPGLGAWCFSRIPREISSHTWALA